MFHFPDKDLFEHFYQKNLLTSTLTRGEKQCTKTILAPFLANRDRLRVNYVDWCAVKACFASDQAAKQSEVQGALLKLLVRPGATPDDQKRFLAWVYQQNFPV
uniref:Uncharacterized protein n=1 Tax=Marseillevirus LCMAC103 TaxID=2506604 RepID=A0A481YV23_9VIRU|nr:MAG: hypothetical protein LCMAC103_00780 [Marseillevirus LCMAC103]